MSHLRLANRCSKVKSARVIKIVIGFHINLKLRNNLNWRSYKL